jgi:hypothetical protein
MIVPWIVEFLPALQHLLRRHRQAPEPGQLRRPDATKEQTRHQRGEDHRAHDAVEVRRKTPLLRFTRSLSLFVGTP